MKRLTETWMIGGFGLAFALLVGASTASYFIILRLNESQRWVAHTDDVLETLNEFAEQLQTAEREQTAYLLTKDKQHQQRYQSAIQSVSQLLLKATQLTQDNPIQQQRLSALSPLVSTQLTALQHQTIKATEDSFRSRDRYEVIQTKLSQIITEEKALMQQRLETSDRAIHTISNLASLGYCLSFALTAITCLLLRKQFRLNQKLADDALRLEQQTSQIKLSNILESITDAFVSLDRDWNYIYVNQRAAQIFDRHPEDLIGKHIWTEFPEGVGQPFYHAYDQALKQQKMIQLEAYYSPWDRWYENRIYPSETGLSIFFQDITPRKRAEIELRHSEERYRALVEATAQFIWTATKGGLSPESQPGWHALTGQTITEMSNDGWVNALHPDDRERALQAWTTAVQTQTTYEARYRVMTAAGVYRHSIARGVPVLEPDGTVREWIGTCTDITQTEQLEAQRRQAEQELRQAKEDLEIKVQERTAELNLLNVELQRSNKELEQFAYIASHDLQEPLRAMISYSQLLEEEYHTQLDAEAQSYLSIMISSSQQMQRLIKDLLAYSRVTSERHQFQSVDCEEVLQQVLNNLQLSIAQTKAQIIHDRLPIVLGDKTQLIQLFQNLISNALKFQTQAPEITIRVQSQADQYQFSIADRGIGIKAQDLDRIFELFRQLHSRHEFPGTGIGLAICKKIIEHHGGAIWADSEFGVGTAFYFTIASATR